MTAAARRAFVRIENTVAGAALLAMVLLPIIEVVVQWFAPGGIKGSISLVRHLTLWVGLLGAAIAAREGKLLALATASFLPEEGRSRKVIGILSGAVAAAVGALLTWGAVDLVVLYMGLDDTIGPGIPKWIAQLVLPIAFGLITFRVIRRAGDGWKARALAGSGLAVALVFFLWPDLLYMRSVWPGIVLIIAAGIIGTPIFALLGGAALLLNFTDGALPVSMMVNAYDLLGDSDALPAIPLFTLAGFVLAEGQSSERLLRVFRAWFGWLPGGTAVVCALVCSFFTVFTGGSGVTILALGGLLLPALLKQGYRERFSLGLLTASGSLGLLLPPALPLILFAVVAQLPMEDLFIGGILPGILLTSLVAAWCVREGHVSRVPRAPFVAKEALASLWIGKWELALPMIVLGSMFGLRATVVEASALTALYAIVVQTIIHRELSPRRDMVRVFAECLTIVGGVLVILAVAVGLTEFLILTQVPDQLLQWIRAFVESPLAFLLMLNVFLLIVGVFIDIFSATVVVVPLILPIGHAFGIHPVHLGIIFIANLEMGYLTPPVGLNLFLSSYRFKKPVLEVARASLPMLAILGVGVLLITYVPWLTLGLLEWLGRIEP